MSEIDELRKQIKLLEHQAEYRLYALERRACREKVLSLKAKLEAMERADGSK